MPIILLAFPAAFLMVVSIILFVENKNKSSLACIFAILCIVFWIFCSISMSTEIYRTETVTVNDVGGASVIAYKNYDNQLVIVNLNKELEKNIPVGTKVKVVIPKHIYLGLFYADKMIPDQYTVLSENP